MSARDYGSHIMSSTEMWMLILLWHLCATFTPHLATIAVHNRAYHSGPSPAYISPVSSSLHCGNTMIRCSSMVANDVTVYCVHGWSNLLLKRYMHPSYVTDDTVNSSHRGHLNSRCYSQSMWLNGAAIATLLCDSFKWETWGMLCLTSE